MTPWEFTESRAVVDVGVFITTPLFQTNFFPDFMHVKLFPLTTSVLPALLHLAPALAAAFAGIRGEDKKRESIDKNAIILLFTYRE
jgi:hypothetical protein